MLPILFWRQGTQLLPFDFLDGFPAFLVKTDVADVHVVDYSMLRLQLNFPPAWTLT